MKRFAFALILIFLFAGLSSCNNSDVETGSDLNGVWESVEAIGNSQFYQGLVYNFKGDNIYEVIRLTGLQDTGEVTGYLYHETGTYSLTDNSIRFSSSDIKLYTGSAASAPRLEDLEQSATSRDETVTISFEENNSLLRMIYPNCNDTDNCIGEQTFGRREVAFW